MRIFKYLIALWTAIAVYTLFSFFGGRSGLTSFNFLTSEKERQLANIRDLEIINDELEKTKNNLLYDHDTMLIHARQMGYGYENERFVRIVGLTNIKNSPAVTGTVYLAQFPEFIPDKYIKIAALCVGLLVFAFLFVMELITKES